VAPDETHIGLHIMKERAHRIGAIVNIAGIPGAGTRVTLTLPMAAKRPDGAALGQTA
jgi:two-component system nitrate/nitrite sensor histidine kinase NarX